MNFSISFSPGQALRLSDRSHWNNTTLLVLDGVVLVIASHFETPSAWLAAFAAVCLSGLAAWAGNTRRQRLIQDLPTSNIASAAQGYVELIGNIEQHDDDMLLARLSQTPCLWYRYQIEKKDSDGDWRVDEYGSSDQTFLLRDDTGTCVIDPAGAEITTGHKNVWVQGDYRYTEYLLLAEDTLYALGEFTTLSYDTSPQNAKQEISNLLAAWKADRTELLRRFDTNNDGELDMAEWEQARLAAEREIQVRLREQAAGAPLNLMRKPAIKRPYLLSNLGHDGLARRYRLWAWAHLAVFFAACGGLAYWTQHFGR